MINPGNEKREIKEMNEEWELTLTFQLVKEGKNTITTTFVYCLNAFS